jgi:hypothetical protein
MKRRQPEVEHLHRAVRFDFEVCRLQIAVDDSMFVCRGECFSNLARDRQSVVNRHRPARDARGEILPVDEFHDDERHGGILARPVPFQPFVRLEAVDVRNVRIVEGSQRARFPLEAGEAIRIASERVRQQLEGHIALQTPVVSTENLAHAAGAKRSDDVVRAEHGSGGEGHDRSGLYETDQRTRAFNASDQFSAILRSRTIA